MHQKLKGVNIDLPFGKEFKLIYDANLIVQANALTIWIFTN
jgi:hypothetical protein